MGNGFQLRIEILQQGDDRVRVGEADIGPHLRVAGGEAREIPESTGGAAQDSAFSIHFSQYIHHGVGQDMG